MVRPGVGGLIVAYPAWMRHLRWLSVVVPVTAVAIIELISDGLLDAMFPFPLDTIIVVIFVAILAWGLSIVVFRRIDRLAAELRDRNADLERREASARALHQVSVAIAALADLDQILAAIVERAREQLGVDVAMLVAYGPDGAAYVAAGTGPDGGIDRAGRFEGVDVARFVRPDLAIARLEAPLQRAGETIGLLVVGSRFERGFEVDEVEMLSSLANQAAIATENARLQARLRELAVVAERERIAREMHDGLAQVLGYVNTKSQAIEELLAVGRTDEARTLLVELAAAARSIYVDIREAILGLRSPVVPGVGLVAAVEAYAARFAEASKIAVHVEAADAARRLDLAPDVDAQVFRIVQEALTNVRKHSGARRAEVSFSVRDRHLDVVIEDDGHGIGTPLAAADRPRYGLRAMRERADSIGALVDWSNPPDGGCRVHIAVGAGAPGTVETGIA
jgi:nitrate/nitrite-specific signal transduction histidine kinase